MDQGSITYTLSSHAHLDTPSTRSSISSVEQYGNNSPANAWHHQEPKKGNENTIHGFATAAAYISCHAPKPSEYCVRLVQEPLYVVAGDPRESAVAEAKKQTKDGTASGKEKKASRRTALWSLEPFPVVEVSCKSGDPHKFINNNPNIFVYVSLKPESDESGMLSADNLLLGSRVGSVLKIFKNTKYNDAWAVFSGLNIKEPGKYRLQFDVMERVTDLATSNDYVINCCSTTSQVFEALPKKTKLPDAHDPSPITQKVLDSGHKAKIRRPVAKREKTNQEWGSSLQAEVAVSRRAKKHKPHAEVQAYGQGFHPAYDHMQLQQPQFGTYQTETYPMGAYQTGMYQPETYQSNVCPPGTYPLGTYQPAAYQQGTYHSAPYTPWESQLGKDMGYDMSAELPCNTVAPGPEMNTLQ